MPPTTKVALWILKQLIQLGQEAREMMGEPDELPLGWEGQLLSQK